MLFDPEPKFEGLPRSGFDVFRIPDRQDRRRAIVATLHPSLRLLGEDLTARLNPHAAAELHFHIPRLDWPKDYKPFCTWLALSRESHGYQSGPQLNLGVHETFVTARLGWDTNADAFGRFEFLGRHGALGPSLGEAAARLGLRFRVFAAAPWPIGSKRVFESPDDLPGSFDEVARRGVWWELGRVDALPERLDHVCSPELGRQVGDLFAALLPLYDRIAGEPAQD